MKVCVVGSGGREHALAYVLARTAEVIVTPVYEELPGWRTDLTEATAVGDLPEAACNYVAFLSEQIGVPVRLVGVGPGREQFVSFATA